MEMIHNNPKQTGSQEQLIRRRNTYLGITLLIAGTVWQLRNFGVVSYEVFDIIFSWPMLLVVIGGHLLVLRKWVVGGIMGVIGICLVIGNIVNIDMPFNKIILPLLCIVTGAAILVNRR